MKFDQFHAWDFGFPRRVFVSEIGFLATWWVGLIAAWFLARIALPKFQFPGKRVMQAMAAIVGFVVLLGIAAYFVGPSLLSGWPGWREDLQSIKVIDLLSFSRVAAIHWAGYIGALIGWIAAMVGFSKARRTLPSPEKSGC